MLRVTVTLEPWWDPKGAARDIAMATIYNDGTRREHHADYVCMAHDMRDYRAKRVGAVENYYRDQDVWNLVAEALRDMGYGR